MALKQVRKRLKDYLWSDNDYWDLLFGDFTKHPHGNLLFCWDKRADPVFDWKHFKTWQKLIHIGKSFEPIGLDKID